MKAHYIYIYIHLIKAANASHHMKKMAVTFYIHLDEYL